MNLFENLQLMHESNKKTLCESEKLSNNVFYHRSMNKNLSFNSNESKEIGLHCGTLEQANEFAGTFLYKLIVDTSKMCKLSRDVTSTYGGLEFLHELLKSNIITKERFDKSINELRKNIDGTNKELYYSQYYRELLNSLGFTGFIYPNEIEGSGYSICIINSTIIKDIKSISGIILDAVKKEISEPFRRGFNKNPSILREDWGTVTIYIDGPKISGFHMPTLSLEKTLDSPPCGYEYVFNKLHAVNNNL